jgi:hypothetical protein
VLGYATFLPWGALHLLADSDIAGTLSGYYAYPFMIASFWPLLGVLLDRRDEERPNRALIAIAGFAAMIAGSFAAFDHHANPGKLELPADFVAPPSLVRQAATDRAVRQLVEGKGSLGSVLVDGSILALAPTGFIRDEAIWLNRSRMPDTVMYFAGGYEAKTARARADVAGLTLHYRIMGTSLRLATDRLIDPSSSLGILLTSE